MCLALASHAFTLLNNIPFTFVPIPFDRYFILRVKSAPPSGGSPTVEERKN